MNHIPTCTNQLYTCDHCTFRAVQTSRGPYVLNNGAGRDLHLAAIVSAQAEQRAWVACTKVRLIHQYRDHEAKPSGWMAECKRLLDHIKAEFET